MTRLRPCTKCDHQISSVTGRNPLRTLAVLTRQKIWNIAQSYFPQLISLTSLIVALSHSN